MFRRTLGGFERALRDAQQCQFSDVIKIEVTIELLSLI
jgi:hypothetical protein